MINNNEVVRTTNNNNQQQQQHQLQQRQQGSSVSKSTASVVQLKISKKPSLPNISNNNNSNNNTNNNTNVKTTSLLNGITSPNKNISKINNVSPSNGSSRNTSYTTSPHSTTTTTTITIPAAIPPIVSLKQPVTKLSIATPKLNSSPPNNNTNKASTLSLSPQTLTSITNDNTNDHITLSPGTSTTTTTTTTSTTSITPPTTTTTTTTTTSTSTTTSTPDEEFMWDLDGLSQLSNSNSISSTNSIVVVPSSIDESLMDEIRKQQQQQQQQQIQQQQPEQEQQHSTTTRHTDFPINQPKPQAMLITSDNNTNDINNDNNDNNNNNNVIVASISTASSIVNISNSHILSHGNSIHTQVTPTNQQQSLQIQTNNPKPNPPPPPLPQPEVKQSPLRLNILNHFHHEQHHQSRQKSKPQPQPQPQPQPHPQPKLLFQSSSNSKQETDDTKKRKKELVEEEDGDCSICLELFYPSNNPKQDHSAVALKCGHVFGKACISKWIQEKKNCPMCKRKSLAKDMLPLFLQPGTRQVTLSEETIKLRNQLAQADKEKMALKQKITLLKSVIAQNSIAPAFPNNRNPNDPVGRISTSNHPSSISTNRNHAKIPPTGGVSTRPTSTSTTSSSSSNNSPLAITPISNNQSFYTDGSAQGDHTIKFEPLSFVKLKGSSVFDYSKGYGIIVTNYSKSYDEHCLVTISSLDSNTSDFIPRVHNDIIRDVKINYHNEAMVCSVSQDKTLKLFNIHSKSLVCRYSLNAPLRSCEFDRTDPNIFYASSDKTTFVFDIRNVFQPRSSFDLSCPDGSKTYRLLCQPAIAEGQPTPPLSANSQTGETGLFLANNDLIYWNIGINNVNNNNLTNGGGGDSNKTGEGINVQYYPLGFQGQCIDVGYDPISTNYLATFRSTPSYAKNSHVIFKHIGTRYTQQIKTIYTDSIQSSLSRSIIFTSSNRNFNNHNDTIEKMCYTASSNEQIKGVNIWNVHSGRLTQSIKTGDTPCDLLFFSHSQQEEYLLTLSPQMLHVFKNNTIN